MDNIAEMLKTAREEAGIDLSEVSKDLNINEVTLMNIEEGKIGAFKDIFELKEYISIYVKYLGIDEDKIFDEFNEYLFDYTSKIPVKDVEKQINEINKDDEDNKVLSPYTISPIKSHKGFYILIYVLLFALVIAAIFWSVNQITIDKKNAYVISYEK